MDTLENPDLCYNCAVSSLLQKAGGNIHKHSLFCSERFWVGVEYDSSGDSSILYPYLSSSTWRYVDGRSAAYLPWYTGYPSSPYGPCVFSIGSSPSYMGSYRDASCDYSNYHYYCVAPEQCGKWQFDRNNDDNNVVIFLGIASKPEF